MERSARHQLTLSARIEFNGQEEQHTELVYVSNGL